MFRRLKDKNKKSYFYPIELDDYRKFFEKNFQNSWIKKRCLCGKENDYPFGKFDRHLVNFETVICKSCGLLRAAKYLNDWDLGEFYKKHYRRLVKSRDPEENYYHQYKKSIRNKRYELIDKYIQLNNKTIFDIGGSSGGFLNRYKERNKTYLFDYDFEYLNFAKKMGINIFFGGLDEALATGIQPDLIILSHVIEHWNNFESEILKLYNLASLNTLIYIEVPGLDSLVEGRRHSDILGDIQVAHQYYFTSRILKNILENYGFSVVHIDTKTRAIIKKDKLNKKKKIKNFFLNTCVILILAEIRMYLSYFKICFKKKFF